MKRATAFPFHDNFAKPSTGLFLVLLFLVFVKSGFAQLSPGDLSQAHAHLEGLSNCTKCHELGEKVGNEKCLNCHTALKNQIDQNRGYHVSKDIRGKNCIICHSEHHGRKFKMIRFDKDNFNHSLTGYDLLGTHKKLACEKCHKVEFIADNELKKRKDTFLGLNTGCLNCHTDYHQKTLPSDCKQCHDFQKFKPATKFNHANTKFPLKGKHAETECSKCHKTITKNGVEFREFAGIAFASCTNCHKDAHNNKFGPSCIKCHNEQSFHVIKSLSSFDHDKTNFKLENKHRSVDCKKCHKTKFTDHLSHNRCTDCHADYHKGQFKEQGLASDCSDCHSTTGFDSFTFSIEQHNKTGFKLEGAHLATPCFVCHKKGDNWDFSHKGNACTQCHDNIHLTFMDEKYFPEGDCKKCHSVNTWTAITFDHSKTGFELLGKHRDQSCHACHFKTLPNGTTTQRFAVLHGKCTECHKDEHYKQFEVNGVTDCTKCHGFSDWNAGKFDHNNTRFPLDGKHKNVACSGCHKKKQEGTNTFVLYKLNEFKCENCHY